MPTVFEDLYLRESLMRIVSAARPIGTMLLVALGSSCSENNDLDPGTFTGQLSGARSEALSGSAVAGVVFTETGVSHTISLVAEGTEYVFLTVSCRGDAAPAIGTYPIGVDEEGCTANYRRTIVDPFTEVEEAAAASGSLTVRESESGAVAGIFQFTGPLVVGESEAGSLTASATFDAVPIAGGVRTGPLDAGAGR